MERLSVAMNDIISAIKQSETLVKHGDEWIFDRYDQGDTMISVWMLYAMVTPDVKHITIAIVSWDELSTVWNDESIHVMLVHDEDDHIVLKFGPLTSEGREEFGAKIILMYDPTHNRWIMQRIFLGHMHEMSEY